MKTEETEKEHLNLMNKERNNPSTTTQAFGKPEVPLSGGLSHPAAADARTWEDVDKLNSRHTLFRIRVCLFHLGRESVEPKRFRSNGRTNADAAAKKPWEDWMKKHCSEPKIVASTGHVDSGEGKSLSRTTSGYEKKKTRKWALPSLICGHVPDEVACQNGRWPVRP